MNEDAQIVDTRFFKSVIHNKGTGYFQLGVTIETRAHFVVAYAGAFTYGQAQERLDTNQTDPISNGSQKLKMFGNHALYSSFPPSSVCL